MTDPVPAAAPEPAVAPDTAVAPEPAAATAPAAAAARPVPEGLLVVDKPAGWTSHDVVARARRLCGTRRVGHAGTLDPMATGVLVLGVGRSTKLLTHVVGVDKEYEATIRLGASTITDDAEGEVVATADPAVLAAVDEAAVRAGVLPLTGDLQQVPSSVSAIKIAGERSYARVRAGEDVELPARPVRVPVFEVGELRRVDGGIDVDVRVVCSSGTYVRALARDLGAALGVGGHLTALRRTRVGPFDLSQARTLEQLAEEVVVLPPADAARAVLPVREVTAPEVVEVAHGRRVPEGGAEGPGPFAAVGPDGTLVAVLRRDGAALRPQLVFAPA